MLQKEGQKAGDINFGSKLYIMRRNSLFSHQHPTQQKGDKHTQKTGVYLHLLMSLFSHSRQGEMQMEAPATLVLPLPGLTCRVSLPAQVPPARQGMQHHGWATASSSPTSQEWLTILPLCFPPC